MYMFHYLTQNARKGARGNLKKLIMKDELADL